MKIAEFDYNGFLCVGHERSLTVFVETFNLIKVELHVLLWLVLDVLSVRPLVRVGKSNDISQLPFQSDDSFLNALDNLLSRNSEAQALMPAPKNALVVAVSINSKLEISLNEFLVDNSELPVYLGCCGGFFGLVRASLD
jgi:hypothetical protein